jgi:molybdopterin synthase sulfur carrier subunit
VVTLRYFAAARDAAGTGREPGRGATVGAVLDDAVARHGERLAAVIGASKVWLNGDPAEQADPVTDGDEVAVLPPVSGGGVPLCGGARR